MEEVPGGVPSFEPLVRYYKFGDSSVDFTVTLRAKEFTDQDLIRHEFIKRLHGRYEREGIEFPLRLAWSTPAEHRTSNSNRQTRHRGGERSGLPIPGKAGLGRRVAARPLTLV